MVGVLPRLKFPSLFMSVGMFGITRELTLASPIPSSLQPRVSQEDSLTYAELELVRPRSEPQASSSPDPAPSSPDTVYAQILFQEKQL